MVSLKPSVEVKKPHPEEDPTKMVDIESGRLPEESEQGVPSQIKEVETEKPPAELAPESRKAMLKHLALVHLKADQAKSTYSALFLFSIFHVAKVMVDHDTDPDSNSRLNWNAVLITLAVVTAAKSVYNALYFSTKISKNLNGVGSYAEGDWTDEIVKDAFQSCDRELRSENEGVCFLWGLFIGVVGVYWLQYFAQPGERSMEFVMGNGTMVEH